MNSIINIVKKVIKLSTVAFSLTLIASCGGGGDSSVAPVTATSAPATPVAGTENTAPVSLPVAEPKKDYTPDAEKLLLTAQSSADLYVESDFNFNSHQQVTFNVKVTDIENKPMANKMLAISSINSEIVVHDDPRLQEKSLLTIAKTNNDGQVYLTLEVPQDVDNVLLELNALGMENDVIQLIDDAGIVMYHFQASINN